MNRLWSKKFSFSNLILINMWYILSFIQNLKWNHISSRIIIIIISKFDHMNIFIPTTTKVLTTIGFELFSYIIHLRVKMYIKF